MSKNNSLKENFSKNTIYAYDDYEVRKMQKDEYLERESLNFANKIIDIISDEIKNDSSIFCKTCLKTKIQKLVKVCMSRS